MRKEYVGAAPATKLQQPIDSSAMSFELEDATGFPTGVYPFVVAIGRGSPQEEKVLCSSRVGNVFAVQQRGYDGTLAAAHSINERAQHVYDSISAAEANEHQESWHIERSVGNVDVYVDAVNGSDSAPGTLADPYASLAHAIGQIPNFLQHDYTIHMLSSDSTNCIIADRIFAGGFVEIVGELSNAAVQLSGSISVNSFVGAGLRNYTLDANTSAVRFVNLTLLSRPDILRSAAIFEDCTFDFFATYGVLAEAADCYFKQCNFGTDKLDHSGLFRSGSNAYFEACIGSTLLYAGFVDGGAKVYLRDNNFMHEASWRMRHGGEVFEDVWHTVGAAGEPALQNGWLAAPSYPVQYRRWGGTTHVRGRVNSGTSGTAVFTLPVGLETEHNLRYATVAADFSTHGLIEVGTDSTIKLTLAGTTTQFVAIDCSFLGRQI
jgi:hypothetical protein